MTDTSATDATRASSSPASAPAPRAAGDTLGKIFASVGAKLCEA